MLPMFSLDSADQNKVSSLRGIFSFNAGLALAILTPKLLAANGGEKVQASWTTVALIYGVLCLVFEGICYFGVKENGHCNRGGSAGTRQCKHHREFLYPHH